MLMSNVKEQKGRRPPTVRGVAGAYGPASQQTVLTARSYSCTRACCNCERTKCRSSVPNIRTRSKQGRNYTDVETRRTPGNAGFFDTRPSCCFRLNISSISRLGPMYSKLAILKDEPRKRGICICVLCLEWKCRLMQSSARAIRPVATTTLFT